MSDRIKNLLFRELSEAEIEYINSLDGVQPATPEVTEEKLEKDTSFVEKLTGKKPNESCNQ